MKQHSDGYTIFKCVSFGGENTTHIIQSVPTSSIFPLCFGEIYLRYVKTRYYYMVLKGVIGI